MQRSGIKFIIAVQGYNVSEFIDREWELFRKRNNDLGPQAHQRLNIAVTK